MFDFEKLNKDTSFNYTPAPKGTHVARLIKLIDLGTHEYSFHGDKKLKRELYMGFGLPLQLMENDEGRKRPVFVSKKVNLIFSEKSALRQLVESWLGEKFNNQQTANKFKITSLIGKSALVSIVHDYNENSDRTYAKIDRVIAVPEGTEVPAQVNDSVILSLDPKSFNDKVFKEELHNVHQDRIKESPEYKALLGKEADLESDEDEELEPDSEPVKRPKNKVKEKSNSIDADLQKVMDEDWD